MVEDLIDRVMVDPRLNANPLVDEAHHKVPPAGFKYLVTEMLCWASGRTMWQIFIVSYRCCARAASGHAAVAPPMSVMKSRRLMGAYPKAKHHGEL